MFLLLIGLTTKAQSKYQIGFMIVYEEYVTTFDRSIEKYKMMNYYQIDSLFQSKYKFFVSSYEAMNNTGVFIFENGLSLFYCEMKFIKPNGKFRRSRMKQKDVMYYSLNN